MDFTEIDKYSSPWDPDTSIKDFPSALRPEESSYFNKKKDFDWNSTFSKLFDKTRDTDKWQSRASQSRPYFGDPIPGTGGQILENLGIDRPPQQAPFVLPGVEGKKGFGSTLGTLAGIGASFIPGLGPGIAAAMPSIGSNIGSLF